MLYFCVLEITYIWINQSNLYENEGRIMQSSNALENFHFLWGIKGCLMHSLTLLESLNTFYLKFCNKNRQKHEKCVFLTTFLRNNFGKSWAYLDDDILSENPHCAMYRKNVWNHVKIFSNLKNHFKSILLCRKVVNFVRINKNT